MSSLSVALEEKHRVFLQTRLDVEEHQDGSRWRTPDLVEQILLYREFPWLPSPWPL